MAVQYTSIDGGGGVGYSKGSPSEMLQYQPHPAEDDMKILPTMSFAPKCNTFFLLSTM